MEEIVVHVEAEVNPTEDEDKVKAAVNNILGNASITIKPSHNTSSSASDRQGDPHERA